MKGTDGFPGLSGQIHHVANPAQVLIKDLPRVREVDVRLFGTADAENEAALDQGIGVDGGVLPRGPEVA
ncbi:hypothetical protein StoSoilB20_25980 [Arthrobacter sp. StoSoilB20]|nr:hypothetical protein StoSoilB20_25980 [Arthrobacter sp. StoSoilB20]